MTHLLKFYILSKHPEVEKKIFEEVEQVIGSVDDVPDWDYSYDKIGQLCYTHDVSMKVLRIQAIVPNDDKYAS